MLWLDAVDLRKMLFMEMPLDVLSGIGHFNTKILLNLSAFSHHSIKKIVLSSTKKGIHKVENMILLARVPVMKMETFAVIVK